MVAAKTDNPGSGMDPRLISEPHVETPQVVLGQDGFLPLYCVMCHRELFSHIGGFIKNYFPAAYEDEELAHRMRAYGYKQAICGKSWVHHEGGTTLETICRTIPGARSEMEKNRDRCIADISRLPKK
jgi:GT2 family glycosyltransferase